MALWVHCWIPVPALATHLPTVNSMAFLFDPEDKINALYMDDTGITLTLPRVVVPRLTLHTVITTLSGQRAATLHYFDASTGHLISEQNLHPPQEGILSEPLHFGHFVTYVADKPSNVLILMKGHQLSCIDRSTGEVKWAWTDTDQGYVPIHKTSAYSDAVHA